MGNINTKFFDDLTNKATWSAGVAFKRSNALPLDKYSVFENLADAQAYIADPETTLGYPGQVIAVAEDDKMVVYVLREVATVNENEETVYSLGLDRVGIVPTGDSKTISVTEDGQISLLVEKGADIKAGAQLTLTAEGKLKWTNPDTSTAEGQDAAIKALQATVDGTETEDGLVDRMAQAEIDIEALEKAISGETSRAEGAEKALDEKITALNKAVSEIDFVDEDELAAAIEEARTEITKEIDDDVKIAKDRADEAYVLANGKVDAATYAADKAVLDAEDAEIREIAENAQSLINEFLTGSDTDDVVNKLKEIQKELKDLGDAVQLEEQFAAKADKSYVDDELAKKADQKDMEDGFKGVAETIEGLVELADNTYAFAKDLSDHIEEAEETISNYKVEVSSTYATKEELTSHANTANATYATKEELTSHANAANEAIGKKANADEVYTKTDIDGFKFATQAALSAEAEEARAAEAANAAAIKAISEDYLKATDKTALENSIDLKVNSSDYNAKVINLETGISEAKSAAATAKNAADAAQGTADSASAAAQTNAVNISVLQKAVNGEGENPGLISNVANHENRVAALEGTVSSHTTQINNNAAAVATKAEQADLNAATNSISELASVVGDSEGGLVKTVAGHTATLTNHENRIVDLEYKADNDTTYTFENGTEGTFKVTAKGEAAKTIDTGAKAYADNIVASAKTELNGAIASAKEELEGSISGLSGRLDTAEADIDELQSTIQGLSGAMHFKGVVESDPTSDEFDKDGYADGDVVIFGNKEFVFNKGSFAEFGDASGNASAISALDKRVEDLEKVDHDTKHADTLAAAKTYAEGLTNLYATAEQGRTAETAIQTIAADEGLTATVDEIDSTKVTIGIDTNVVFIFNGGSALSEW